MNNNNKRMTALVCAGTLAVVMGLAGGAAHAAPAPAGAEVARLTAEVDSLEAVRAVRNLQRAYGFYIDRAHWDEATDLFADDATIEVGQDGVYVGKARIREYLQRAGGGRLGLVYGQLKEHQQLQPVIHVSADGLSAKGRWRDLIMLGEFKKSAEWGDGIYENTYVKDRGVWKIKSLHLYINFIAPYEGGWARLKPAPADWRTDTAKAFPPDRPPTETYRPYPEVQVPPFHYQSPALAKPAPALPPLADPALAEYRRRVGLLRDRDEVENLQAAYGYYFDKSMWKEVADLFSKDGTFEYGQMGVYVGPARIRAGLKLLGREGPEVGKLNNYTQLQAIVHVAPDGRTAKARWRGPIMLQPAGGAGAWGDAVYENEYVKEGGVWRISKEHVYLSGMADYDGSWAKGPIAMAGPSAVLPPDKPPTEVYRSYPGAYVPPFHYNHPVTGQPMNDPEPADTVLGRPAGFRTINAAGPNPPPNPALSTTAAPAELARRIERLEDANQIEIVQRAYGYFVDKALWTHVTELFGDHASLEIGGRGVFVGLPHIVEYLHGAFGVDGAVEGNIINHMQFQFVTVVAPNGNTATLRSRAFVMSNSGWGLPIYENQFAKENGVWKISVLHAPFTMYTNSTGWAKFATPNTRPDSFGEPPDREPTVVYLTYPSPYTVPYSFPNPVTGKPWVDRGPWTRE